MNIKVGDKVSFLNEKGGGVVVAIKDKNTVMVSDDNGFETPYPVKQVVKLYSASAAVVGAQQVHYPATFNGEPNIALLYIPNNQTDILQSDFDIYLRNTSGYHFYYELGFFEAGKVLQFSSGQVNDGVHHHIKSITRAEIEAYSSLYFQCVFNSTKKMEPLLPFTSFIQVKASKFYKEASYLVSEHDNKKLFTQVLAQKNDLSRLKPSLTDVTPIVDDKDRGAVKKKSLPHHVHRLEVEIDLHIGEILEDHIDINPSQMLAIQMRVFKSEMDKAIQQNYASITFIHGIGKGILKSAIHAELEQFTGIKFYPANFQQYGNGATKVEII
jgi:hypothetical protein